jgi:hypothetical protein
MNVSDIEAIIQNFKNYIPYGHTKTVTMKCCMQILTRMKNFETTGKLDEDYTGFDDFFYNELRDEWCKGIDQFTVDDPKDTFSELFADFRYAAHRAISNYEKAPQQMQSKL